MLKGPSRSQFYKLPAHPIFGAVRWIFCERRRHCKLATFSSLTVYGHRLTVLSPVFRPPILHDFFRGSKQPMGVLFQFAKGCRGKMFVGILSWLAKRL